MADPKRLVERVGPGFERELLGMREVPGAGTRERVEARVLEAAALGALVGASSAGATGKLSSGLGLVLAKWLGVGLVLGTVTAYVGSEVATTPRPAPRAEAPARVETGGARASALATATASEPAPPEIVVEGRVPPPASPSQGDVRIGATKTLMEAESMRRIRAEARNDRAQALRLLDEHLLRFPDGESAAEARRLRAELGKK